VSSTTVQMLIGWGFQSAFLILAILSLRRSMERLHLTVNSKMDELLRAARALSFKEGEAAGTAAATAAGESRERSYREGQAAGRLEPHKRGS